MVNKKPIVVAMVGLIGSGKSSVALALAPLIRAKIIKGDTIRIALRKKGKNYTQVNNIAIKTTLTTLKSGGDVILDSDFIDAKKRKKLEKTLKPSGAKVVYLRTFSDRDAMIERLIKAKYSPSKDLFKNATIAMREMWRRTPHHYNWSPVNGGRFTLKKLKIPFIAQIDTTMPQWRKKINEIATKIKELSLFD